MAHVRAQHFGHVGLGVQGLRSIPSHWQDVQGRTVFEVCHLRSAPDLALRAKWLIQQHHERQSHRVASGMERARPERAAKPPQPQPLACPIARLAESPQLGGLAAEDAALFKGNVPS